MSLSTEQVSLIEDLIKRYQLTLRELLQRGITKDQLLDAVNHPQAPVYTLSPKAQAEVSSLFTAEDHRFYLSQLAQARLEGAINSLEHTLQELPGQIAGAIVKALSSKPVPTAPPRLPRG